MGIPYADPTNTGEWAHDLLYDLGAPATAFNVGYLEAWQHGESPSGFGYNPLGEETTAPGSVHAAGNSASVQAYTSWAEGLDTTASNLESLPQNAGIVKALRSGDASFATLSAAQLEGGWSGGGESAIAASGTSTPFTYGGVVGESPGAKGVATSPGNPTGWFGQWIEPTLENPFPLPGVTKLPGGSTVPGGGVITNAVGAIPKALADGTFGPIVKWIGAGAADITFIGFGLLLVLIGLGIAFKGEAQEAIPLAAAAV